MSLKEHPISQVPTEADLAASPRRLTSKDIASAAGVSQATVSNVLNRPDLVAPETRRRVHEAMNRLNFIVNDSARSLRLGRTRALGVVALDLANPFWGEATRGVEAAATAAGYSLLLGSSEENAEKEHRLIQLFQEHRVDGLILGSIDPRSDSIRELHERGTRTVLLDQVDPDGRFPSVSTDQAEGTALAMRHLLDFGHRRVAFVHAPYATSWSEARRRGLCTEVTAQNLDPDQVIVEVRIPAMTAVAAESMIDGILSKDVTAIICANDLVALGVLKQLTERGIRVPEDLSLIGFDDSYFAAMLSPGLTTVRQHPFELGRRAAQLILEVRSIEDSIVFPAELVARQSVAAPRI